MKCTMCFGDGYIYNSSNNRIDCMQCCGRGNVVNSNTSNMCERCGINEADGECVRCTDYICDECSSHKTGIEYTICQECLAHDEWIKSEHFSANNSL